MMFIKLVYQINLFINILFAIRILNKYILYTEGLSKGTQATQSVKCTNEKITCNTQDMNLSWYVPKANVDHTIRGQGTSTVDHLATTPSLCTLCYYCVTRQSNVIIYKYILLAELSVYP